MKNDDYENFLKKYNKRIKDLTKDNVVYPNFQEEQVNTANDYYYEWDKKFKFNDSMKANVNFGVSTSFLDRFETALARVDIVLDRLLDYLHDKKNR
jgi:hypothetical protein